MSARNSLTQTDSAEVARFLGALSKDCLIDLVIDLVRRGSGEDIDGEELLQALQKDAEPILRVRGTKAPRVQGRR